MPSFLAAPVLLLSLAVMSGAEPASAPELFKETQAIFQNRCYECHGPEKEKGGLRLDTKAGVIRGGDSGEPLFRGGKPGESLVFKKITSSSPDEVMPPKGDPLSEEQISTIKAWIEAGAAWPDDGTVKDSPHWAYVKPERPTIPEVTQKNWPRNPIDHFILARLEDEKLVPSPEADQSTLIRRLALDLVGLPPTVEEMERFGSNHSEEAWDQAVDYYLNSPHYGEQRARLWLDLARYADSHGYERDPGREMWPFRDWVINAFNENMPFDQFTLEQIAGDMLPGATLSQKVASGFHRNTMLNTEGGVDREEARVETIIDRVNTTATVWLGSTLACAQCHTHKYDPFTIKEYYQFYAFFNNINEPEIEVPSAEQAIKRDKLKEEITRLDEILKTDRPELQNAQAAWEYRLAEQTPRWSAVTPAGFLSTGGANLLQLQDGSILASGPNPANDTYTVVAPVSEGRVTGFRLEVFPDNSLPKESLGRHPNGSFVLSKFEVKAAPKNNPKAARRVELKKASADYIQNGHSVENLIDDQTGPGWAVSAGDEKMRVPRYVYFQLEEPINYEGGAVLTFDLKNDSQWGEANIGRFRISTTSSSKVIPEQLPPTSILKLLSVAPLERTAAHRQELAAYFRSFAPELASERAALASAKKELEELQKHIPKTLAIEERMENRRETQVHIRGSFMNKGEKVEPGIPAILPRLKENRADRVALARWLTDRDNPLTARVAVNRYWAQLFGHGLVETEEDFGTMGALPTLSELLDWLAVEFMENGWNIKALHKLIVTSATYRQSSTITPDLLERDPANQLYARGPRFRVPAEGIRDIALTASGLLKRKVGGPSVYPYQPDRIWTQIYGNEKWQYSAEGDQFRRGLYTYWKRTSPYPAFMTFDAPSRELCTARRPRTNTPLQALTTLNDPAYIEAAQALARRIMGSESDQSNRVDFAYLATVSRKPREAERDRVLKLFETEAKHYSANLDAAKAMAFGENGSVPEGCDPVKAAAWTVVANVLLNLDETITKN